MVVTWTEQRDAIALKQTPSPIFLRVIKFSVMVPRVDISSGGNRVISTNVSFELAERISFT